MTRLGIVLGVTLLVCGIALGVWQRVEPDGADAVRRWVVDGPQKPEAMVFSSGFSYSPQGAYLNGERVDMAGAKTAITDGWGCDFDIVFMSPPPGSGTLMEAYFTIAAKVNIDWRLAETFESGGVWYNRFAVLALVGEPGEIGDYATYVYPADGSMQRLSASAKVDAGISTSASANPIGADKANQTHAKEGTAADEWYVPEDQYGYASVGSAYHTDLLTAGIGPEIEYFIYSTNLSVPDTTGTVFAVENIAFSGAEVDASELGPVEIAPGAPYQGYPDRIWAAGSGSSISYYFTSGHTTGLWFSGGHSVLAPRMYSFTGLSVVDMDGTAYPDIEVWCPAVQVYDATAEEWQPQKKTVAEWNAATFSDSWGYYSWDADPPPDGAVRLLAAVSFGIDFESASNYYLDGIGSGLEGFISFLHDLCIVIDGWPLSAEDRTSSPYVTGIASIAHRTNASVYGPTPALAHDDWAGSGGATSPDIAGDFMVSSAGGGISLALPSGYEDRLSRVASLTAPLGIPELATVHQADYFYPGDGDAEACYCGRGWPCLRFDFPVLPGPAELSVTLTAKTYSHSYPHETGEARQTEYDYTPSTTTYTYPLSVAANGVGYIYLAAPDGESGDEPDLEVVTHISISGFGEGSWRVGTPYWSLDPNEAITNHSTLKFFENWRYADGGLSAQVDSVMHYALMDTTETNNGHDNPVEANTLRIFEYVQSPNYEIDLSAASPLKGYIETVTACSDAWEGTYSEAAAEAATVDEDEAVLKTLLACDLKPVVGHNGGAMDVAVRVGVWTTAPGLLYDFTARKIIKGAIHGAGTDGTTLLRAEEVAPVWWRPADLSAGWTQHDAPTTDMAAHWRSGCGPVYHTHDPASILRDYGLGWNTEEDPIVSTGRWAAREYDYQTTIAQSVPGVPWLHFQRGGILHVVWAADSDGVVRYGYVEPWSATPELLTPGDDPFGGTGGYANPCITSHSCGLLVVAATRNGIMEVSQSRDLGATWTPVAGSTLVGDLANGTLAIQDGYLAACGHDGTSIVYRSSSGEGRYVADPLYSGGATEATVCAAAMLSNNQPPRSQVLWHHGALYALVETEGGASLYASDDGGVTWSEVAGTHIATTLRAGNLAWQDGELLACGYTSGGVVRVQSAYDPTRAPEAFYVGGPTSLQVTDGELGSAIECAHGERWVAVVPEELALYRMRAPAEGFEEV